MNELIFNSPKEYLNYDFDDSWGFFIVELEAYGLKRSDVEDPSMVDYSGKFRSIIKGLFKIYEQLIIVPDQEELLGVIGNTKILIKKLTQG